MAPGIAAALGPALLSFEGSLQSVLLSNNVLVDEGLSAILEALVARADTRKLVVANNDVGPLSSAQIIKLLGKPQPNNLDELRLIACKAQGPVVIDVLESVREGYCYLKRLGLVKMQLNGAGVGMLIDALPSFPYLVELDLSWNSLFPESISKLLSAMKGLKKLQSLNLAWNSLGSTPIVTKICKLI